MLVVSLHTVDGVHRVTEPMLDTNVRTVVVFSAEEFVRRSAGAQQGLHRVAFCIDLIQLPQHLEFRDVHQQAQRTEEVARGQRQCRLRYVAYIRKGDQVVFNQRQKLVPSGTREIDDRVGIGPTIQRGQFADDIADQRPGFSKNHVVSPRGGKDVKR